MTGLTVGAERRRHPVYRYRAVYWATVYRDDKPIFQIGPYRKRADALRYADQERRKIAMKMHTPGPRVDLPGQMELPQTAAQSAELARRKAAAPLLATKTQKPCDIGLFSDEAAQLDLVEMLQPPTED